MSPTPIYIQIADHVEAAVAVGDLRPGEKLAAHAALAEAWEVGLSTISSAIALLKRRGVLVTGQGKGTFVAERR